MQENVVSVTDLTLHVKAMLESMFPSMWVAGEISDFVRARSGHLYFTLKDDESQIRGVMWRSNAERMKFDLTDGQAVLCYGDVEVYAPRGTYQLVVRKIEPQGIGALQLAFQKLHAKLSAEGLFEDERKRALPSFPQRIGIVTSASGAAVRDFLQAAANRYPGVEIVVIPALVQGDGAPRSIVSGIRQAHKLKPKLDVLIVSRGGGSLEDLWCFNDESVVRALAKSKIPTVSAVGHEIDVTLSDLVSDVRALTPTDAATRVLPDAMSLRSLQSTLADRLHRAMQSALVHRRLRLDGLSNRPILMKPLEFVHLKRRMLDELDARAQRAIRTKMQSGQSRIAQAAASLSALSPLRVLERGYSVTLNENSEAITSSDNVSEGDVIRTRLRSGEIESVVRKTEVRKTEVPDSDS